MQNHYAPKDLESFNKDLQYTIVYTEWNPKHVNRLTNECENTLKEHWIKNIKKLIVPWSLELPFWAMQAIKNWADIIITIWTVIRWDTSHYDHVCEWVTDWIMNLQLKTWKPIIFGVLTCENEQQVEDRIYKGKEWALSAISLSRIL